MLLIGPERANDTISQLFHQVLLDCVMFCNIEHFPGSVHVIHVIHLFTWLKNLWLHLHLYLDTTSVEASFSLAFM